MADDAFDAFGDTEIGDDSGSSGDERSRRVAPNKMQKLDRDKQQLAKENAFILLNDLQKSAGGDVERSEYVPPEKRARMDEDQSLETRDEAPEEDEEDGDSEDMRIQVHTIKTDNENCVHEVAVPPGMPFAPLSVPTKQPAKAYPFQLDAFQKEAILCIENNQSVLVSAHTSAGKTVVAQYAIARCLKENQRVIYTSPIKALSNQKFRELEEEFGNVGLMTGDVTLNPDASCLVMTTEILRSMLYRGSEITKEVGWVIFDEIHYMRDKERGVVWEESIILMPSNVRHAFLSATIPNARQFAQWVCWLHSQPCHVVYTDYRPTPLQHFIFPVGGSGLYEVVNVKGEFRDDKFKEAMNGLAMRGDQAGGPQQRKRKKGTKGDNNVLRIIRTIKENDMLPSIVFSFSRKECESYALSLKDMDFNTKEERDMVGKVYNSAIDNLSDDDRQLPQIGSLLPLLRRGIGVHHSGLLPLLKETIEILFGEGLLKVLFATETFSMGLNMPARTVIFTSARKFDGQDNRFITSGEYIQMSGRAGRRGKDDKGVVILMVDHQLSADDAKHIIKGATDPLNSQFRLTYNMVLNLMRVDDVTPENIVNRSFFHFQKLSELPEIKRKIREKRLEITDKVVPREQELSGFVALEKQIEEVRMRVKEIQRLPKHLIGFMHAGRLLKVVSGNRNFEWGVLVDFKKKVNPDDAKEVIYVLEVLLAVAPESMKDVSNPLSLLPGYNRKDRCWTVVPMTCDRIDEISAIRLKLPEDLSRPDGLNLFDKMMREAAKRFRDEPPLLDPIADMKIGDNRLLSAVEKAKQLKKRFEDHPLRSDKNLEHLRAQFDEKAALKAELAALNKELKEAEKTTKSEELDNRRRVLRRLEYCARDGTIEKKGRVACELSASDELILTEMLFSSTFSSLDAAQTGALLSCFVFQENGAQPKLSQELSGCLRTLQEFAKKVAAVSNECRLEVVEDKYVNQFKAGLMDVVYNWIQGASFGELVKSTDVFEGTIIRCLRRLEEVLRELVNAAKAMENKELEEKFELARTKLKRDIVFAASLYL
ncbi:unnamed protein product [Caenorhabditis auriculariae]|uniref:Uncharacterized protein n=1 Tax=Caenorhabditis auriculariae TaxID=2777116 RepID=A0A8S1HKY7_9PELO|nr:unnamed protein product [Caenorhabditis auriculariae]